MSVDVLFFLMCLLVPFAIMVLVAVRYVWIALTYDDVVDDANGGTTSAANARRAETPNVVEE